MNLGCCLWKFSVGVSLLSDVLVPFVFLTFLAALLCSLKWCLWFLFHRGWTLLLNAVSFVVMRYVLLSFRSFWYEVK